MSETSDAIYFFRAKNKFGYLSNFYPCSFTDAEGTKFNCSEQYFMFRKAKMFDPENHKLVEKILHESDPKEIKALGRQVKNYVESVWKKKRMSVMIDGLRLKFQQNKNICQELLSTGTKDLYEASPYDIVWGIGFGAKDAIYMDPRNFGRNLLGKALVQVRKELASDE